MGQNSRYIAVKDYVADIGDINVEGICIEDLLNSLLVAVSVIEDCRQVHQHKGEDVVEVLYILENNEER